MEGERRYSGGRLLYRRRVKRTIYIHDGANIAAPSLRTDVLYACSVRINALALGRGAGIRVESFIPSLFSVKRKVGDMREGLSEASYIGAKW